MISLSHFFVEGYAKVANRPKHMRVGQTWMNHLAVVNRELARSINGTEFDPFFDDKKLTKFFNYLFEKWK